MRVLVTRPEPSAARTAAALLRRGHQPVLLPMMRAHHHREGLWQILPALPAALVLTSSEALRALADLGAGLAPLLPIPLYAVGTATAAAASRLGFASIIIGSGDGEALAERILADRHTFAANARILYLAGMPRSPGLEARLTNAGVALVTLECYHMEPVDQDPAALAAALAPPPEAVLFYSAETARHFLSLPLVAQTIAGAATLRLLCLSEKIAQALPPEFRYMALWPEEPREELLLDLI
jgi:uroporphyrinogen-III synthase